MRLLASLPVADDAMLYQIINKHTDQDNLQHDFDRLIDWEQSWQMTFNPYKCELMHITRSELPIDNSYRIHDETPRAVPVPTHLGIDMSNNFSWIPHINQIVNKANSKLEFIKDTITAIFITIKLYTD